MRLRSDHHRRPDPKNRRGEQGYFIQDKLPCIAVGIHSSLFNAPCNEQSKAWQQDIGSPEASAVEEQQRQQA